MLGGIALLGTITATIASWLVERVTEREEAGQAATRQQVDDLSRQVHALQTLLMIRAGWDVRNLGSPRNDDPQSPYAATK